MNFKFLVFFILFFGCSVNPNQTYKVYTVIDSNGKTYNNLTQVGDRDYLDLQGREYRFHGNYTAISSTISGYDILRLRTERE